MSSSNQRHVYSLIIRSGLFDSAIIGTSTARLLDPEILNPRFGARFANLSMNAMVAWEQRYVLDYFRKRVEAPKALIVAIDHAWCDGNPVEHGIYGFPEWLYDDNPWNDIPNLLNRETVLISGRLLAFNVGLTNERVRRDGFQVFVPPESQYDLARAQKGIWARHPLRRIDPIVPAVQLSPAERQSLSFRALGWLERILAGFPASTVKVLSHMPVHIAAQPIPGSRAAAVYQECKDQIAAIARTRGAIVVDWNFASPITSEDSHFWDPLHSRLPIAGQIANGLADAALEGRASGDGSYHIIVR